MYIILYKYIVIYNMCIGIYMHRIVGFTSIVSFNCSMGHTLNKTKQ